MKEKEYTGDYICQNLVKLVDYNPFFDEICGDITFTFSESDWDTTDKIFLLKKMKQMKHLLPVP
ncbi:hypothetical protein RU86_GL001814 [Lactococcus piscium]|uniref:Uncharacterized protein n=1 Tax=Pseudolactococcus piscium TaxID=1364 RepID=A0A2A5RT70_9LACT|nr:hypothetical protein RU86_GL001814 [Lactococcus piscium]